MLARLGTLTEAEWVLRGVALVEAALEPKPLLAPDGNFFPLISDLNGEFGLSLIVAVLGVVAQVGLQLDQDDLHQALNDIRTDAMQTIANT